MPRLSLRNLGTQLRFDGTDDFVTTAYVPSTTAFSVAFWIKLTAFVSNQRFVDWQDAGPANGFTIFTSSANQQIRFRVNNDTVTQVDIATNNLELNKWYHVVCTYTNDSAKLYLNGVEVASDTSVTMTAATATLTVGKRSGSSNFGNCWLDEVLIYEKVLSATEISNLYFKGTIPKDPKLFFSLDDGTMENSGVSDVVADETGSNNGTNNGGTSNRYKNDYLFVSRFPLQKNSYALRFGRGGTDRANCSNASALTNFTANNALTFEAYLRVFSYNNNVLPRIFNSGQNYLSIMGETANAKYGKVALEVVNTDASSIHEFWGDTSLILGRWYHVAGTFKASTRQGRVYIDGLEDNTDEIRAAGVSWTGNIVTTNNPFIIGNVHGAFDRVLDGEIKYVRVYNRALSKEEIFRRSRGDDIRSGLVGEWMNREGTGSTIADTSGYNNVAAITGAAWRSQLDNRTKITSRSLASNRLPVT